MTPYRTVFTRQTLEFVVQADDEVFEEIERWVNRIERTPATPGDYSERDEDQRELQVVVLRHVAVVYWPDHAAREVRVVGVEPL